MVGLEKVEADHYKELSAICEQDDLTNQRQEPESNPL